MTKRSAFLLLTLALLLMPGLAAAGPAPAPLPATDLSWLSCPAPEAAVAVSVLPSAGPAGTIGVADAVPLVVPDCCASRQRKCWQDCFDTGIAHFACSPATCHTTWTCICN